MLPFADLNSTLCVEKLAGIQIFLNWTFQSWYIMMKANNELDRGPQLWTLTFMQGHAESACFSQSC